MNIMEYLDDFQNPLGTLYSIDFGGRTTLSNLRLNGNNYISETPLVEDQFYDLRNVTITGGDMTLTYPQMTLVQLTEYEGEWWFILAPVSDSEIAEMKLRADVEYLAMMMGVDL